MLWHKIYYVQFYGTAKFLSLIPWCWRLRIIIIRKGISSAPSSAQRITTPIDRANILIRWFSYAMFCELNHTFGINLSLVWYFYYPKIAIYSIRGRRVATERFKGQITSLPKNSSICYSFWKKHSKKFDLKFLIQKFLFGWLSKNFWLRPWSENIKSRSPASILILMHAY